MTTQLPAWHDFYLGTLSASAALMGLLFVAVSLVGSLVFSTYLSWDLVFRAAKATPAV